MEPKTATQNRQFGAMRVQATGKFVECATLQAASALQTQEEVVEDHLAEQDERILFGRATTHLCPSFRTTSLRLWTTRRAEPSPQVFRSSGEG